MKTFGLPTPPKKTLGARQKSTITVPAGVGVDDQ
jgi:hypothetical protein